jgi:tRNA G46 methylase TrmB
MNFSKLKNTYQTMNLYENTDSLVNNVQTEYEQKFVNQGIKIKKLEFIKT